MTSLDRFAKRKALNLPRAQVGEARVPEVDRQVDVPLAAAIEEILDVRTEARFLERMDESKMVLLRSVAVPFGLGHLVSAYDRVGGDVNTIKNARSGVYATEEKERQYKNRGSYKLVKDACHSTSTYKAAFDEANARKKAGQLKDAYTGKDIPDRERSSAIDHTISAKTVFNDPGRVLAGLDAATLSTIPENLNPTHFSINGSKQDATAQAFIDRLEQNSERRRARIDELEAKLELTEGEHKELASRKALEDVDAERLREKHEDAQDAIDSKINQEWYLSLEFAGEVIGSCARSTVKTGVMAAFGEFLVEFLAACFDEVRDWYLQASGGNSVFDELKVRLARIADRVVSRKDAAWKAFKAGSLAGFISALISVIVNSLKTTQKRVQRMLREGAQSLVRVVALLAKPSGEVSARESLYSATHVVLSTGLVLGGVVIEELIEDAIKTKLPVLAFAAEPIAVVLSGVVAGLSVVTTASLLDRWDPLGVVEENDLRHVIDELHSEMEGVWGHQPAPSENQS